MRRWKLQALKFYRKDPKTIKDFHSVYLSPGEFGEMAAYLQTKLPLAGNTKQKVQDDTSDYTCMIEGGLFEDGKLVEVYQVILEPVPEQMRWINVRVCFADENYSPIKKELNSRFRLPYTAQMSRLINIIKEKIKLNPAFQWEMDE